MRGKKANFVRGADVSPFLLRQSKQLVTIADEKHPVGGYRSRVDGATHVHLRKHLLLLTGLQDNDVTVFVPQIDLSVGDQRRSPHRGKHVVNPISLPGLGVQTVEEATEVGVVDETIMDGRGRDGPSNLVVMPDPPALSDVSTLGSVDAV